MAETQQEIEQHLLTWNRFIKSSLWMAGGGAVTMALLWIFLV